MSGVLEGVEPRLLWKHFEELSKIPRCSKHEAAAAQYVISVAEELGLEYHQDVVGNVMVICPATEGREGDPITIIQGHLDMVCEKADGHEHDFTRDPIVLERDGKWLTAKGTSLGADNGVGVCTGLALMESGGISHGPLECLFTIDEETGLTGASQLTGDFVKGRRLLNLDSEEDGSVYIGCAGGLDMQMKLDLTRGPIADGHTLIEVRVGGLRGGHSGIDINAGRGNSIKLIAAALKEAVEETGCAVAFMEGGSKRNALARDARAVIALPEDKVPAVEALLKKHEEKANTDLAPVEEGVTIGSGPYEGGDTGGVWMETGAILKHLLDLPHGMVAMSPDIEDLVETSVNLATMATEGDSLRVGMSGRSSVGEELRKVAEDVKGIAGSNGFKYKEGGSYPGWKPNLDSDILRIVKERWMELYETEPEVKAIHAGLECGIIGEKFPGMDMLALGPQLEHPHSPDERVDLESMERLWKVVVAVLEHQD